MNDCCLATHTHAHIVLIKIFIYVSKPYKDISICSTKIQLGETFADEGLLNIDS